MKWFANVALMILVSCGGGDGGQSDQNAQIRFDFPEVVSQQQESLSVERERDPRLTQQALVANTAYLNYVGINISGPGMVDILSNWDRNGFTGAPPPPTFDLPVPSGPTRLIQVIAVYEDPSSQEDLILYGEVTQDIVVSDIEIPILLNSLINEGTMIEREIIGRYVDINGNFPTFPVGMYFQPRADARRMKLGTSWIVAGYFEAFFVEGLNFSFVNELTQETLLGNLGLSSPEIAPSNAVMQTQVPNYRRYFYDGSTVFDNGDNGREETIISGFFGPGVGAKVMCYPSSTTNVHGTPVSSGQSGVFSTDSTATSTSSLVPLEFRPSSGAGDDSKHIIRLSGGVPSTDSRCSSGTEFSDYLTFNPEAFNTSESLVLGLVGPFAPVVVNNGVANISYLPQISNSNGTITLTWAYSGIASVSVDIFYKTFSSTTEKESTLGKVKNDDIIECDQLAEAGFTKNVSSYTGTTRTINFGDNATASNSIVTLCPVVAGGYVGNTVEVDLSMWVNP